MCVTFFTHIGGVAVTTALKLMNTKEKTPLSCDSGVSESGRLPGLGFRLNYDTVMMPLFRCTLVTSVTPVRVI